MIQKRFNRFAIMSLISLWLIAILPGVAHGEEKGFKDITREHWAYKPIMWAYEKGVIAGYPDGTFKPEKTVTQTEFISMLIRAYVDKNQLPDRINNDWGSPYIQYANNMGWSGSIITPPSSKLNDIGNSSEVIYPRKYVAMLIANTNSRSYSFDDSIQFLLDKGLAAGKTDKSIEGFKGNDILTRAEAVTFIKNLREKQDELFPLLPGQGRSYDPATLNLEGFENHILKVTPQPTDPSESYSNITFHTPTTGYSLVHEASYTIEGTVIKAVGENLHFLVEYWDSGFFKPTNTLNTVMKDGKYAIQIHFPKEAVYRITVTSDHVLNDKKSEQSITLASFYVNYKN